MKRLFLGLIFAAALQAQTAGSVDITSTITATAGSLVCIGTPTIAASVSTMHMRCSEGATVLHESDYTVTAPGSVVYSIGRGADTITWLLTKGNPAPDQWQVSANGVSKTGNF